MINKYIILDEIELEIFKINGEVQFYWHEDDAIEKAKGCYIDAWQVIEIPFGDC